MEAIMRRVNTIWELEPELRNKIWAETLEEILKQFEAMPHISDEVMLEGLGINRQMIYQKCPWLHPANRNNK
jgi:hypothetical protein